LGHTHNFMKIVKIYIPGYFGNLERKKTEADLFASGFKIESEEEVREWDNGKACCLLILCFPLVFFAKGKKLKVTYSSD